MSQALTDLIRLEIAQSGSIPFRRFMELALYHPDHGYYAGGRARLGRNGDFFTNVSVGPIFGKLLARQFAEIWSSIGQPTEFSIVEQGAHDGQFAADVLAALHDLAPKCYSTTIYRIVEPSAALARRQRELLAGHHVAWCSSLEALGSFTGVHFSNELIDAFPVHLVTWDGHHWLERHVSVKDRAFAFVDTLVAEPELAAACAEIPQPLPPGYTTEVNLAAREWVKRVATRLERGFVLAIDYGYRRDDYYSLDRYEGTLSAYRLHHRERNPLSDPGEIDLTAHVEFTSLIEAAEAAGLRLAGFTDQHHFMVGLGALHFPDGHTQTSEIAAFKTLMHPTLMGMAFKVLCLSKGTHSDFLQGFRFARP